MDTYVICEAQLQLFSWIQFNWYIDGLVQERHNNSIADALDYVSLTHRYGLVPL